MHATTILPILALAITTLTAPLDSRRWGPSEYYSLGCPTNTTKPYASQYEQTQVLNTFANEVFVHQEVALGYDTYAAVNFINHAPEVAGVGNFSVSSPHPAARECESCAAPHIPGPRNVPIAASLSTRKKQDS